MPRRGIEPGTSEDVHTSGRAASHMLAQTLGSAFHYVIFKVRLPAPASVRASSDGTQRRYPGPRAQPLAAFGGSFRVYLFFYLKFTIRSAFCQPIPAVLLG